MYKSLLFIINICNRSTNATWTVVTDNDNINWGRYCIFYIFSPKETFSKRNTGKKRKNCKKYIQKTIIKIH